MAVDEWDTGEVPRTDIADPAQKVPAPEKQRLLVLSGPDQGKQLLLERGTYLVGKAPGCDLVLTDNAVSRQHLELQVTGAGVLVKDLGSTNGSFFGGARFSEVTVGPGAVVTVGATELKLATVERSHPILPSTSDRFGMLLGPSLKMREVFAVLELVAQSDVAVLVEGETGTGKELCAEAIRSAGPRAKAPFVVCDLAGVSRSLIESELFGHVRGAFTGADRDREGAFEQAHGGTIFIDEIGELELDMQPRLLRALESRKIKPVGAGNYRDVDVRVIAATNRDLREEVKAGRFRDDLYHRLAVVRVTLPPLRERKEDVAPLVQHFLAGKDVEVPQETMGLFTEYDWPGNVRELKNVIDRGLSLMGQNRVLLPSLLGLDAMPPGASASGSGQQWPSLGNEGFREAKERLIASWERDYVTQLLRRAGGNVSKAAREGGLDRVYLHRLIKKYGIANVEE
ncbi:MAG: response regulator HsfA [bacterium]|nr:response regulator HsfA [bacterium]